MNFQQFSDMELMIGNMYGEARLVESGWSDDVREYLAIGGAVMNRTKSPRWGNTPKVVILQPYQFSWTNQGDPSRKAVYDFLINKPEPRYRQMKMYAEAVLEGRCIDFSNGADHYVALWLYERESKQAWIKKMEIKAIWGGHIFLKDK